MDIMLPKLYSDSFCWSRWRKGIAIWREIGVASRYYSIIGWKEVLIKYAIGYLEGSRLVCRPKNNEIAVMFLINDEFCWTHFRMEEFVEVFTR